MKQEELFEIWAPSNGVWSPWAKPTPFAHMRNDIQFSVSRNPRTNINWNLQPHGSYAVVVDLPNEIAVQVGLGLVPHGFRPVPLFNGCSGPGEVVTTEPLLNALEDSCEYLRTTKLPDDSPPAFLLDSHRMAPGVEPSAGAFDNRWLAFPQDFPSGNLLFARGIRHVLLLQQESAPRDDVAFVLRRWQTAGLELLLQRWPTDESPRALNIPAPSIWHRLWHRWFAHLRYHRNSVGGFGEIVPSTSQG